jgi:hypothetical protein
MVLMEFMVEAFTVIVKPAGPGGLPEKAGVKMAAEYCILMRFPHTFPKTNFPSPP